MISNCKKPFGKKIKKKLRKRGNPKPQEQERNERKFWRPYNPWPLP